jgi:hypothetical protein
MMGTWDCDFLKSALAEVICRCSGVVAGFDREAARSTFRGTCTPGRRVDAKDCSAKKSSDWTIDDAVLRALTIKRDCKQFGFYPNTILNVQDKFLNKY